MGPARDIHPDDAPEVSPASVGTPVQTAESAKDGAPINLNLNLEELPNLPIRSVLARFPGLDVGSKSFTVYYAKNPNFGVFGLDLTPDMAQDYIELGVVKADKLGEVFGKMQGENWSPQGEAKIVIWHLGLHHTSMSVGDLVYDHEAKKLMARDQFGWTEVTPKVAIDHSEVL
jgi:hypothetical protein